MKLQPAEKVSSRININEFLPFSRPSLESEDIEAVVDVLKSGWITTGAKTAELESAVSSYTGARHSIAVTSATGGMHLLLHALGIGPGDEVITPSMTWVSTVNLIVACGATPVFVDVDKNALMCTSADIEQKITSRTKLIIPVHFAGAPLDLGPIRELAARKNITLVEDAAHSIGTKYRDQYIGAVGTAIFSFHPIKNVTTGEGGMICTDNDELAERLKRLKFHGLAVDAYDRETQGRAPQAEVIEPGFKYNLPDMNSVLALGQLKRLNWMNAQRSSIAKHYQQSFEDVPQILPLAAPVIPHVHAWHLFVIRLDIDEVTITRDEFMAMLKQHNIGSGLHFRAVHTHKYYREHYPQEAGSLVNTEWNSDRILSLPLFPAMTLADADRVVGAITEILKDVAK